MKLQLVFLWSIIFVSTGCSTAGVKEVLPTQMVVFEKGSHTIKSSRDLQYMSCDSKSWFVSGDGGAYGANPEYQREGSSSMHALDKPNLKVATDAFHFAIMASNVYRDPVSKPIYELPGWRVMHRFEYDSGLALEELHRFDNGKLAEIVVIYKGTDGITDIQDMKANLSVLVEPQQYTEAQRHFKQLLDTYKDVGVTISVAGHSLGGGIALNVSLRHSTADKKIAAYLFNSSPRGFFGDTADDVAPNIYFLSERGDFLRSVRWLWHLKIAGYNRLPYNFLNFTTPYTKPVEEHSIYLFSRALLLVAIGNNSDYAREVFKANFEMINIASEIPSVKALAIDRKSDLLACKDLLTASN